MEQNEKKLPILTREELYEYAKKVIKWIDPNDENDPDGRYWLACYQGCGDYTIIIKDRKIQGAIHGNISETRPFVEGYHVKIDTWFKAVKDVISDRIGDVGTYRIAQAYGSGTRLFLKKPYDKKFIDTREYDVPSVKGGLYHNIEII